MGSNISFCGRVVSIGQPKIALIRITDVAIIIIIINELCHWMSSESIMTQNGNTDRLSC